VSAEADLARGLVERVISALADSRPVFHSEADFQHAFAWEAHRQHPEAHIRLERRLSAESNERLDLLLTVGGTTVALELKYPVAKLDAELDGEPFLLRAQGAEDRMRFNYIWDIVRLERLVAAGVADIGTAVVVTNASQLWRPRAAPRATGPAADTQFSFHEGVELVGRLEWVGTATWWQKTKPPLPETVELIGRYSMQWRPYSTVTGVGRGEFRWLCTLVTAAL
jgi:hypothetical protein